MAVGEDESVSVEPLGVLGAEVHVSGPEDVGGRSHSLGGCQKGSTRGEMRVRRGDIPWAHRGDPSWPISSAG